MDGRKVRNAFAAGLSLALLPFLPAQAQKHITVSATVLPTVNEGGTPRTRPYTPEELRRIEAQANDRALTARKDKPEKAQKAKRRIFRNGY